MKRRTGRILELQRLTNLGACSIQVDEFYKLFGSKVKVTQRTAVKHAEDLNFYWAGTRLLSPRRQIQFNKSYDKSYDKYVKSPRSGAHRTHLRRIAAEFARLYNLEAL